MPKEETKDKCDKCAKRRKDGFVYCVCGNKLWITDRLLFKSFNDTGNSHQGVH